MNNSGAITTLRLQLRQWRASDREPFAALNADPEVMRYFPSPLSKEASDAMADRCEAFIAQRGWGLWAVETIQEAQFAGFVGLSIPTAPLPFCPCVEIGWRLGRQFWGKGLATEAASAVLSYGFTTLNLPEIVSFTSLQNLKSQAVMERIGMKRETTTFEHPNVPEGNRLREHCLYRLNRKDWQQQ